MQLVAPDILAEARGLSVAVSGTGVGLGLALWLTGWRGHRFWIVLTTTLLAGVFGLASGPAPGAQPLVSAVLLAVGAGALALNLSRVVAFAAGGTALAILVHALAPTWNQPLACFVAGGLAALLFFRSCIMVLTSFAGTLLLTYSGFCLADRLGKLDAVAWTGRHAGWLNWACLAVALLGWLVQFLLDRRLRQRAEARQAEEKQILAKVKEQEKEAKAREKEKAREKQKGKAHAKPWWGWEVLQAMRRAG
jgi:MFS family permease